MCGVMGLFQIPKETSASIAEVLYSLLPRLQHRGQDGAGLTVLTPEGHFETARGLGLIDVALQGWTNLPVGRVAVAHTRYATTGRGSVGEVQPFVKGSPKLALAHNGNLVNASELAEKYRLQLESSSDLDVLLQVFLLERPQGFEKAVQKIFDEFNGSYAVVGVEQDGTLFGFRDPFGIRPLFLGKSKEYIALASETCALTPLGLEVESLEPGEWVRIEGSGKLTRGRLSSRLNPEHKERFCMFELVYFSSPQSEVRTQSVYRYRFELGRQLAQEILSTSESPESLSQEFDYVVPVPETSRTAAIAVAETLKIPYREYLVKNPYISRTFILGSQSLRLRALEAKLGLIGPEIRGQRILLVDDSVVRGNTSRLMAQRLRDAGARSVSLASTCPPIRHGCFYGIDFPDPQELIAHQKEAAAIESSLGVDHLYYISVEGLKKALGTQKLCLACLTGEYPTRDASFERFLDERRRHRAEAPS